MIEVFYTIVGIIIGALGGIPLGIYLEAKENKFYKKEQQQGGNQ